MTTYSRRVPEGLRRLAWILSVLVLSSLATALGAGSQEAQRATWRSSYAASSQRQQANSRPYLTVTATPSLRVRPTVGPPQYAIEPAPPGISYLDETSLPPAPTVAKERMDPAQNKASIRVRQQERTPNRQDEEDIPAILPDDLRQEVRPEDVIPFFSFPGSANQPSVSLPVPQQAPGPAQIPSSATYQQH